MQIGPSRVSAEGEERERENESERGDKSHRGSGGSAVHGVTFHNDNILLLIPTLNESIDLIEQSLHPGP